MTANYAPNAFGNPVSQDLSMMGANPMNSFDPLQQSLPFGSMMHTDNPFLAQAQMLARQYGGGMNYTQAGIPQAAGLMGGPAARQDASALERGLYTNYSNQALQLQYDYMQQRTAKAQEMAQLAAQGAAANIPFGSVQAGVESQLAATPFQFSPQEQAGWFGQYGQNPNAQTVAPLGAQAQVAALVNPQNIAMQISNARQGLPSDATGQQIFDAAYKSMASSGIYSAQLQNPAAMNLLWMYANQPTDLTPPGATGPSVATAGQQSLGHFQISNLFTPSYLKYLNPFNYHW